MSIDNNYVVKITTNCPGNCICCSNRQKGFDKKGKYSNFDLKNFERICAFIVKECGKYVCLSGGEPTIITNLEDYIKIAHDYGLATRINTNGWNVTLSNLEKWYKHGLDQIVLSLYGISKTTVSKLRGNENIYEKSLSSAKIIGEFKKNHELIFILQTVIMKNTYKELPYILKLAIDNKADRFWPSYLEDAFRLDSLRMNQDDILDFKNNIVPKMKAVIVNTRELDMEKKNELSKIIDSYFDIDYSNGIYHKENEMCKWIGKHFTFYNNGLVDPCPGHEYFMSNFQYFVDYNDIDGTIHRQEENGIHFSYCRYCPQGKHIELILSSKDFHEHSGRY